MYRVTFGASLLLVSSFAVATPTQDQVLIEQQLALQAAMDEISAELLKPGPKREGWDKGGVDLYQLVEAAPGGATRNYLLGIDKDGERTITIVGARDLSLIPKQWQTITSAGSSTDVANSHSLSIGKLEGKYYIVGWDNVRRVGNAFCSTGSIGGKLYERPDTGVPGEMPPEMMPAFFAATVQMLEKRPFCWRYDRVGDRYRTSYFLEDGRTLPMLDGTDEMTVIVPARSVETLLDGKLAQP